MKQVFGTRNRNPRQRLEVDDRRIEPRGGVAELEGILRQRDPTVGDPPRLIGDLAEGGVLLAQRRGIEVRALRLSLSARRLEVLLRPGELIRLRVRHRFAVAPLLDQLARLGFRRIGRPPRFKRTDIGQTERSGMAVERREEAVGFALNGREIALCVLVAAARLEESLDRRGVGNTASSTAIFARS